MNQCLEARSLSISANTAPSMRTSDLLDGMTCTMRLRLLSLRFALSCTLLVRSRLWWEGISNKRVTGEICFPLKLRDAQVDCSNRSGQGPLALAVSLVAVGTSIFCRRIHNLIDKRFSHDTNQFLKNNYPVIESSDLRCRVVAILSCSCWPLHFFGFL